MMNLSKLTFTGSLIALTVAAIPGALGMAVQDGAGTAPPPGSLEGLLRPGGSAAREPGRAVGTPLRPIFEDEDSAADGGVPDLHELEENFRIRLLQSNLESREAAFDEIAEEASTSPTARMALEAIAEDLGDPDLAFTARLTLREADRSAGRQGGRSRGSAQALRSPQTGVPRGLQRGQGFSDPFEAMQQRMEAMLQGDPFMAEFFASDPFAGDPFFSGGRDGFFRRGPGLFGRGGASAADPFEELRQRTEDLRKQFDELQKSRPQGVTGGASSFSSSSSMSVETTPKGVRVEITEDDGTGPSTRVYEAPTMEALLEANPELKGRVR